MLIIRAAQAAEFGEIREFYDSVIDKMKDAEYSPRWEKGIYPADKFLRDSIANQELYVGIQGGEIVSAMVINHESAEGYEKVRWNIMAAKEEVSVIHILGILPEYQGRGIAKQMVKEAIRISTARNQKAIRLDVLASNIPAQRLYVNMGFQYIDKVKLFYEDTGVTDFLLYEYII